MGGGRLFDMGASVVKYNTCNKFCHQIGQSEVSISHRDLQVSHSKCHRDLNVF